MIPYRSQLFFANNGGSGSSTYYLRQILPDNNLLTPEQTDGASLVSYNGELIKLFGWYFDNTQSNKLYNSADLGRTFGSMPNAPFTSAEQQVEQRADGNLWIWPTTAGKIYKFDGITWTKMSDNAPSSLGGTAFLYNDKMHYMGGQQTVNGSPINDPNLYRYNDDTDTWEVIGTRDASIWLCTGCAWVDNGVIYATGGGEVTSFTGTYNALNDKVIKSIDGGVTWTVHATLPVGQRSMWPEALKWDGKIWYINGYASGANQVGVFMSEDHGATWSTYTTSISGRHATSLCIHDDSLYIGYGNLHNDLWRIEKIVYPEQGFIVPQVQTWWEKQWPASRASDALLTAVNTLFNTLNTTISLNPLATNLQCLDFFAIAAGVENEDQWLIPIVNKNTTYLNSTIKHNSPTWTTGGIYSVAAGSGYYELNWNPQSYVNAYVLDSASGGVYVLSNETHEVYDYGNGPFYMVPKSADVGGRFYGAINSADFAVESVSSGKGYRGMSRRSSTSVKVYIDGSLNSITKTSSTMGAANFTICGVAGYGSPRVFGFCFTGDGDVDHTVLRSAIQTFFTTRGVSY